MILLLILPCMLKIIAYTARGRTTTLYRSRKLSGFTHTSFETKEKMDGPSIDDSSSYLKGTLIARIVPKVYEEFQSRKPPYPIEPKKLSFSGTLHQNNTLSRNVESKYTGASTISLDSEQDSNNIVEIDVVLSNNIGMEENVINPMVDANIHIHMNRSADEMTPRTLQRLQISLTRKIIQQYLHGKGTHKRHRTEQILSSSSSIILKERDFTDVAFQMTISQLWLHLAQAHPFNSQLLISYSPVDTAAMSINLNPLLLQISSCPPTLLSVKVFENFDGNIFTHVPIVIETELIYATHAIISWFVNNVEVSSNSNIFIPTEDHLHGHISVCIRPVREDHDGRGFEEAYAFRQRVTSLPYLPMIQKVRGDWIQNRRCSHETTYRIVSYNLLADLYASRESAQCVMFSHCDPKFLCKRRRFPMIIAELIAYDADVICLQEVDLSIFDSLLRPTFEAMGYQGYYTNKMSVQKEGCAMFWSLERFELADDNQRMSYGLRDLFTYSNGDSWDMEAVNNLLTKHDELRKVTLEKTGQVLQIATLKPKQIHPLEIIPPYIVVANTHLFFHPMADHVRALQAYVVARKIDQVRCDGPLRSPFILSGDLNSDPLSGAAQLLLTRSVHPEHRDCWKNLNTYHWQMGESEYMLEHEYIGNKPDHRGLLYEEEAFQPAHGSFESMHGADSNEEDITPPTLRLPNHFPDVISGYTEMPIFTNYAVDFVETLDYILASTEAGYENFGFITKGCAPMPTIDEIRAHVAMPNEFMPSDHVAVVCEFQCITGSASR